MMKSYKKVNVAHKRVLVRAGLDVPIDRHGVVISDFRLQKQIPLLKYLLKNKAKIILMGHRGRPGGKGFMPEMSMAPIAEALARLVKREIALADDCVSESVANLIANSGKDIVMLENLRFYADEKKNTASFAKQLSELADIYIDNAFSVAHRKHASMHAITRYLPSYAGEVLLDETKILKKVALKPKKPFVLVVGGLKIASKIDPIKELGRQADTILIGGALANTFLYAQGYAIGKSVYREEEVAVATRLLKEFGDKIVLPIDVMIARDEQNLNRLKSLQQRIVDSVKKVEKIYDIGPKSIDLYNHIIGQSKMVFWAGPLGLLEFPDLCPSTQLIMQATLKHKSQTIFAGGDTVLALDRVANKKKAYHVSEGGGAALDFVANKKLPALDALGYYK